MTENDKKQGGKYKRGTVVHTEKPFVFVLKEKLRTERCDHCFSKGELRRCQGCLFAYYCDRECQKKGWFYHRKECSNLQKVRPSIVPDTARMIARILIKLEKGGAQERSFYSKTKSRVFKDLMSHYSEIKKDTKKMEYFVSLVGVLKEFLGEDSLPNAAELLGIYGRVVINSFNILDHEMQCIGIGLYLGASVLDHSCSPNAVAVFNGTTISIRTLKDLDSVDLSNIYISYRDVLNLPLKRREDLEKDYYFLCQCEKCNDMGELNDLTSIICQNESCRNAIPGGLLQVAPTCSKCKTVVSNEKIEEMNEVINFTEKQFDNMEDVVYLDICRMCLNKQENLFHFTNIYNIRVLEMAFESCIALKNWKDGLMYGLKVKNCLRKYYGEWHPLYGIFLVKLGKMGILESYDGSRELILEAAKIFSVVFGSDHPLVKNDIRDLLHGCPNVNWSFLLCNHSNHIMRTVQERFFFQEYCATAENEKERAKPRRLFPQKKARVRAANAVIKFTQLSRPKG